MCWWMKKKRTQIIINLRTRTHYVASLKKKVKIGDLKDLVTSDCDLTTTFEQEQLPINMIKGQFL
jgi:hypothetical protein